ncbi:MAG: response regulator, partial [Burkholderiales bacterium]|nr:response regulator [Burkholderiales bacterium]
AECRAMMEPQAQKRGIGMVFVPLDALCYVMADRTRLKQVFINVLFNAIKYNQVGGHVTVQCTLAQPNAVRISVRDTGRGLAPDKLAQLFQPFNRLGQEQGTEEGTGIGLVVAQRLVQLMGGDIGADSTLGVGSEFWVRMPLTTPPRLDTSPFDAVLAPAVQTADTQNMLRAVLYVEDNPANLELVAQVIARRADLRLLSAADASLGIEYARVYQPDVVLMDINLPGLNGTDAMRILRSDPSTAHMPIIALSANAVPRDIQKCLDAGFFDYVTKPFKVQQLLAALDAALAHAGAPAFVNNNNETTP